MKWDPVFKSWTHCACGDERNSGKDRLEAFELANKPAQTQLGQGSIMMLQSQVTEEDSI